MNFKLLTFALLTSIISFGQEINFKDLSTSSRGEFTSYISQDNATYKIGDRIKIGVPSSNKTFAFITEGDGFLLPITNLTAASSGQETEIKKISIIGNKRTGYSVTFRTKGMTGLSNYTIQFENALSTGEVKGFGKTSDEALTELKKAKDKLDLGLITQEEFDKSKSELAKYIK
ncbi:SHOCT domain-containing protein [Flavobacterium psychrophilum]|uniref:SHOCT domain-containing protein n=1 Tax=Flavobacterium psychrophilum TaxID=96345 RepID=UPI00141B1DC9|nr:SHOCT domain-containing protein [Flavobacterium psychrophilum]MCB6232194.1 SHOCT domain-containing protein [Flavobacterium psychrophilum]